MRTTRVKNPWRTAPYPLRLVLLVSVVLLSGCAAAGPKAPEVTVEKVVALSQAGVAAQTIIEQMRASATVYRLSGSQLAKLHEDGVPDAVLDYMQATYLEYVHFQALRQYGSGWGPYPYWWWGPPGFCCSRVIVVRKPVH